MLARMKNLTNSQARDLMKTFFERAQIEGSKEQKLLNAMIIEGVTEELSKELMSNLESIRIQQEENKLELADEETARHMREKELSELSKIPAAHVTKQQPDADKEKDEKVFKLPEFAKDLSVATQQAIQQNITNWNQTTAQVSQSVQSQLNGVHFIGSKGQLLSNKDIVDHAVGALSPSPLEIVYQVSKAIAVHKANAVHNEEESTEIPYEPTVEDFEQRARQINFLRARLFQATEGNPDDLFKPSRFTKNKEANEKLRAQVDSHQPTFLSKFNAASKLVTEILPVILSAQAQTVKIVIIEPTPTVKTVLSNNLNPSLFGNTKIKTSRNDPLINKQNSKPGR